jgi:hypothetical protein
MHFFSEYPIIKWILVGFGILYVLDKYVGFSPIDNLINKVGKYKFKIFSHLNYPKLKQLIDYFNKKQFNNVEQNLKSMPASYRAFGFKCLGQYGDLSISNEWLHKEPQNDLPKIIKGYQLIHKAWETRGRDTIDKVSNQNLVSYKKYLKQAEVLFIEANKTTSLYKTNCVSSLLKIGKGTDMNRNEAHQLFNEADKAHPNDSELHFNYFAFISPKWGGKEFELTDYLNVLNTRPEFIQDLILAQYYFDFEYVQNYKDEDVKFINFTENTKHFQKISCLNMNYTYFFIDYLVV